MTRALTALFAAISLGAGLLATSGAASAATGQARAVPAPAAYLKGSHALGFVPRHGAHAKLQAGRLGSNPFCPAPTSCNPPLVFATNTPVAGGLVGTPGQVTVTPVYWAPTGYGFTTNFKSIVNTYLANVAADSNKPTNVYSMATQYYEHLTSLVQPQRNIHYSITAGAALNMTTAFPAIYPANANGCVPEPAFSACVADFDLEADLQSFLTSGGKTMDDAHIYVVYFPVTSVGGVPVETCQSAGSPALTGAACSSNVYCAYHSGANVASSFLLYANEPFPDLNGCTGSLGPQAPNGDSFADAVLSSTSHEVSETITDAFGAWQDANGYENGDECAYTYGASQGSTGVATDANAAGTHYNQTINGAHYYTQDEFSNQDYNLTQGDVVDDSNPTTVFGCRQKEDAPVAAFSAPACISVNVSQPFTATTASDPDNGAALTYAWAWGDGTSNSSGQTTAHTYTALGTFNATLTVTDADGWAGTVSHALSVVSGPTGRCPIEQGTSASPGTRTDPGITNGPPPTRTGVTQSSSPIKVASTTGAQSTVAGSPVSAGTASTAQAMSTSAATTTPVSSGTSAGQAVTLPGNSPQAAPRRASGPAPSWPRALLAGFARLLAGLAALV